MQRTVLPMPSGFDVTGTSHDGTMSRPRPEPTRPDGDRPATTTERLVDPVARAGLGVLSTEDLRDVGVCDDRRELALRRGGLVAVHRGVYRPAGVRMSAEGRLRALCVACGPGAVASHRSALWLWGLADEPDVHEVTVPVSRRSTTRGVMLHRSSDLRDRYRFVRRSVPTTTPDRALLDGAAVVTPPVLARAVEQALIDELVSVATLRNILDDLGRRGRRGTGPLRRYLDRRALGDARAESQLEPLMARLCRDHGIGQVLFQSAIRLDGHIYRPDFQIPAARLVIEVDGLDAHASREALDDDLTRQNRFIRHGWVVLRYTVTHLRRPAAVAREIIEVARRRQADRADA